MKDIGINRSDEEVPGEFMLPKVVQKLLMGLQADLNQLTRSSLNNNMAQDVIEGFWRVKVKEKRSLGFLSSH